MHWRGSFQFLLSHCFRLAAPLSHVSRSLWAIPVAERRETFKHVRPNKISVVLGGGLLFYTPTHAHSPLLFVLRYRSVLRGKSIMWENRYSDKAFWVGLPFKNWFYARVANSAAYDLLVVNAVRRGRALSLIVKADFVECVFGRIYQQSCTSRPAFRYVFFIFDILFLFHLLLLFF